MFDAAQIEASLVALAVGDALGEPYELSDPPEPDQIQLHEPVKTTDDTAMSLIAARVIAETRSRSRLVDLQKLIEGYSDYVESPEGALLCGETTRAALRRASSVAEARAEALAYHSSGGRSNSNGTVMRLAPIALSARSAQEADETARRDASLTHHDLAASWASAALAAAYWNPQDPLSAASYVVEGDPRFAPALQAAGRGEAAMRELASSDQARAAWTALSAALWAAESGLPTETALQVIVSWGGDADTNAATAGGLLGSRSGGALPERMSAQLPRATREQIAALAPKLARR